MTTRTVIRESHKSGIWKVKIGYSKKWIWFGNEKTARDFVEGFKNESQRPH